MSPAQGARVHPAGSSTPLMCVECPGKGYEGPTNPAWADLPLDVLASVFERVFQTYCRYDAAALREAQWSCAGVCRSWRAVALPLLLPSKARKHTTATETQPRSESRGRTRSSSRANTPSRRRERANAAHTHSLHSVFWHPMHVFLTQRPAPTTATACTPSSDNGNAAAAAAGSGLTRTVVARTKLGCGLSAFTLYGNAEHAFGPRCFMLHAVQTSRVHPTYLLSLSRTNPEAGGIAVLRAHTLNRSQYTLTTLDTSKRPWLAKWLKYAGLFGVEDASTHASPFAASAQNMQWAEAPGTDRSVSSDIGVAAAAAAAVLGVPISSRGMYTAASWGTPVSDPPLARRSPSDAGMQYRTSGAAVKGVASTQPHATVCLASMAPTQFNYGGAGLPRRLDMLCTHPSRVRGADEAVSAMLLSIQATAPDSPFNSAARGKPGTASARFKAMLPACWSTEADDEEAASPNSVLRAAIDADSCLSPQTSLCLSPTSSACLSSQLPPAAAECGRGSASGTAGTPLPAQVTMGGSVALLPRPVDLDSDNESDGPRGCGCFSFLSLGSARTPSATGHASHLAKAMSSTQQQESATAGIATAQGGCSSARECAPSLESAASAPVAAAAAGPSSAGSSQQACQEPATDTGSAHSGHVAAMATASSLDRLSTSAGEITVMDEDVSRLNIDVLVHVQHDDMPTPGDDAPASTSTQAYTPRNHTATDAGTSQPGSAALGSASGSSSATTPSTVRDPRRRSLQGASGRSRRSREVPAAAALPTMPHLVRFNSKQPHWNPNLRCWCLNFGGRVRLPSARNFQLCMPEGPGSDHDPQRVVLQFGKVAEDVFCLDWDLRLMSPLQALAAALTSFHHAWGRQ